MRIRIWIRIQLFTSMRIRILILLLSKMMRIYDHYWPTDHLL
jgi:hypothetical protein